MKRELFDEENIDRETLTEKILQLAESLTKPYPSAAGILFALSGCLQIKQEEEMHNSLIPFLAKQQEMLKEELRKRKEK